MSTQRIQRPKLRSLRDVKALLAVSSLAVTIGGWVGLTVVEHSGNGASAAEPAAASAALPSVELSALPSPVVVTAAASAGASVPATSDEAMAPASASSGSASSGRTQLRVVTVPQAPVARTRSSR